MHRLSVLLLVAFAAPLAADDAEKGFVPLFNGKDLTGWRTKAAKDKPSQPLDGKAEAFGGRFKVKDGELVIDPAVKGDVIIETAKEIGGNVVIKFEFFPDAKCNNDLFFRGQKFDLSKQNVKNIKEGVWNPVVITVKDTKIEFDVNGEVLRSAKSNAKSTFGIRAEFGAVRVRNMRIKEGPES
jgi:hypothetical protein